MTEQERLQKIAELEAMVPTIKERDERGAYILPGPLVTQRIRANTLRDVICQILSSTGRYPHEIEGIAKAALQRDNEMLDVLEPPPSSGPRP